MTDLKEAVVSRDITYGYNADGSVWTDDLPAVNPYWKPAPSDITVDTIAVWEAGGDEDVALLVVDGSGVVEAQPTGEDEASAEVETRPGDAVRYEPWSDLELGDVIRVAALYQHNRYGEFCELDDITQQLWAFVVDEDTRYRLDRLVIRGEAHRARREIYAVGKRWCETEKAARSGYEFKDVAWYHPTQLAELVPLALDAGWNPATSSIDEVDDGQPRQPADAKFGGTLTAMVMDVRKALDRTYLVGGFDPDTDTGMENLRVLAEQLGGEFPDSPSKKTERPEAASVEAE